MRTTVRLDDDLLRDAKSFASATGRSLTELIEDSLRQALSMRQPESRPREIRLITSPGAARSGVDLNRMVELLNIMEGREP